MRFHWFAQKLFAKKCLKGVPKTCPVNTFGNYPKGDLKQKVGFELDLSDFGKNVHKLYEKCP